MDLYKVELVPEARFSKVPKSIRKFFTPGKPEQNLKQNLSTELFYSHTRNMYSGSLHTRSFRRIKLSVFRDIDNLKWLCGPEMFPGLSRNGRSWGEW